LRRLVRQKDGGKKSGYVSSEVLKKGRGSAPITKFRLMEENHEIQRSVGGEPGKENDFLASGERGGLSTAIIFIERNKKGGGVEYTAWREKKGAVDRNA